VRPSVAFTVKCSTTMGGGTLNVFEYANWLYSLGVDVAVYSDDKPPDWMDLKGRFYHIEDVRERYASITEPVIIVYSVLELQDLLHCCDTKDKVIYHLCQGIEDHHYCVSTYESLMAPKSIFKFLYSLPVGRIAVSPHIGDYFKKNYNQQTIDIFNGIDLNLFKPQPKNRIGREINILSSGNPRHPLKGKADIKEALNLVAKAHPEMSFSLTVACGERNFDSDCFGKDWCEITSETNYCFDTDTGRLNCRVKYGLSPEQMRQAYYDSDIYINSSWYEGFGLPSIEAMACGIPLIQADNHGLDSIVIDGKNCLLIPPNNPRKMAEAIEAIINNDSLQGELIRNGIETSKRFSKEKQYPMFVAGFEKILNGSLDKTVAERKIDEQSIENPVTGMKESYGPVFTVLVPTYNQAKYISFALDSLINQTYQNWEAVVVNDGSTDQTQEIIASYAKKDQRIRIINKENGGAGSALNEGLKNARGRWICWLSSDDLFEPDKLEVHLRAMQDNPDIRFFHTNYYVLDGQINCRKPGKSDMNSFVPPKELQVLKFFEINYFNGISVVIHREVFDSVGYFNEKFRHGQDFDMWLRISALYPSAFIDKRTCATRIHPGQGTKFSIGKDIYDSPGIYDSVVACLEFLNSHEYPALFPALNLSVPRDAMSAIGNTLKVISNPLSFINRCGYAPALIDRLHEWFTQQACSEVKSSLGTQLVQSLKNMLSKDLSAEIKAAIKSMCESVDGPFSYKGYDPILEMERNIERLQKAGETERASIAREYLAGVSERVDKRVIVDQNQPIFSVIVPTYNQADYLPEALKSLLCQTYGNWEAVVVNDGSTDNTADVLNSYVQKDSRIRFINKANGGVASALNEGIRNARGEWICWLSSDDMFEPDKLEVHVQAIKDNPDIRFFHTNYFVFDEVLGSKRVLVDDPRDFVAPVEFQVLHFFDRNCVNGISVAVHREVFDKVGCFNETYRYGQDFDMWLRINSLYRSLFIDRKTVVTRWHIMQGMRSFPEAGSYESSRACVEFLNSHGFSECFPAIDLNTAGGAAKAIKETMAVVFNVKAMMYKCYFNTALLERLAEWLCKYCPEQLKNELLSSLRNTIGKFVNSRLPVELRTAMSEFLENIKNDFSYQPHNFLQEAAQYARKLFSAGILPKANSIERYLSLAETKPVAKNSFNEQTGPLVSVVMPAYNASKYIAQAIESVLNQSYRNFKLIIVDDGSTDNTKDVVAGFKDDRIKYYRKENGGASSARNFAIGKSEGSFIVILDADDMIMPELISSSLDEFEKHPDASLVYCNDSLIDCDGRPIRVIEFPEYTDRNMLIRELFRSGYPIVPFRTCIRKSVFDKIGFYDESLSVGEDYDMMRRFVKQGLKTSHLRRALYLRRMGFDSLSRNFTPQKAECLFEVLTRYADTFDYDELFPDVAWEKISPERRQLHTKYLVAVTYLAIGQVHIKANFPSIYNEMANEVAGKELVECLKSEPNNKQVRELLRKCEIGRRKYGEKIPQTVC
jgi:glycosyltransferase involved in cell wall biosynthesis